ncbi:unnamed protein product [Adineta ricciae]|uniref:Uncharacterized protein n=1 Tax=Adineta ricciae TaxID=249248 RepID=A0A814HUP6_ADIRI|nr:unnamed protein product [Adineta ricciae]
MNKFSFYLIVVWYFSTIHSSHFYGGTVTWRPINNTDFGSMIRIMFTQSYQWQQTNTQCDQTFIGNQTRKIPSDIGTLECATNLSSCENYTALDVNGYCTDYSKIMDTSSSQISNIETIALDLKFCVAYQNLTWPGIISSVYGVDQYLDNATWSLGCCVDLTIRDDGFINTAPVAAVVSPIYVLSNTISTISIPVADADGDILRCRWASNDSIFDECGDICGEIPGSILYEENCTLVFDSTGKSSGDYYAIALMVEDFYNDSNSTALSSISIQFLIHIINESSCDFKPIIALNSSINSTLEVGTNYSFTFTISTNCSNVSIVDYFRSPLLNVIKSNLTFDSIDDVWTITEIWMPTVEQIGLQIYCAVAIDSVSIQSDFYCLTFIVNSTYGGDEDGGYEQQQLLLQQHRHRPLQLVQQAHQAHRPLQLVQQAHQAHRPLQLLQQAHQAHRPLQLLQQAHQAHRPLQLLQQAHQAHRQPVQAVRQVHQLHQQVLLQRRQRLPQQRRNFPCFPFPKRCLFLINFYRTATSTTTTSETTITTTTTQEPATIIVLISTKDNSGLLGLGLGLGLPLGLAFIALTVYGLYRGPAALLGYEIILLDRFLQPFNSHYKFFNRPTSSINQVGSVQEFTDTINSGYHHEETNEIIRKKQINIQNQNLNNSQSSPIDSQTNTPSHTNPPSNKQTSLSTKELLLPKGNSFATVSISDFELNNLDKTPPSSSPIQPLLPPPLSSPSSLVNETVRQTQTVPLKANFTQSNGSVLLNAYSDQEKDKFTTIHELI